MAYARRLAAAQKPPRAQVFDLSVFVLAELSFCAGGILIVRPKRIHEFTLAIYRLGSL
jgi:hypothetical protein